MIDLQDKESLQTSRKRPYKGQNSRPTSEDHEPHISLGLPAISVVHVVLQREALQREGDSCLLGVALAWITRPKNYKASQGDELECHEFI